MRRDFDRKKSRDVKRKHGVSLKEAQEIFDRVYLIDRKSDDPEQVPCDRMVRRLPVFCDFRDQV